MSENLDPEAAEQVPVPVTCHGSIRIDVKKLLGLRTEDDGEQPPVV